MSQPLRESELQETFLRASGAGGQNVNKVETGVLLVHLPTGLWVKCTDERSQAQNRAIARQRLATKLAAREEEARVRRVHEAELQRRRNRKPSKASKRRTLQDKRHRSQVKGNRRSASHDD